MTVPRARRWRGLWHFSAGGRSVGRTNLSRAVWNGC